MESYAKIEIVDNTQLNGLLFIIGYDANGCRKTIETSKDYKKIKQSFDYLCIEYKFIKLDDCYAIAP